MQNDTKTLLEQVKAGELSIDDALLQLKLQPFEELGYANIDTHRKVRNGVGEVIYGEGKRSDQIIGIIKRLLENGQERVLITRLNSEKADDIIADEDIEAFEYYADARLGIVGTLPKKNGNGKVVVATAGTSDIPVAEEAALTLEFLGNEVIRIYDIGVAGIHRTLSHLPEIMDAEAVVAVAGMEGALASVLGGLAECPVIAVPTSVGYGASFGGVSALLSMLNSCSSGVSVVNIDNGFGAGYQASLINHSGKFILKTD